MFYVFLVNKFLNKVVLLEGTINQGLLLAFRFSLIVQLRLLSSMELETREKVFLTEAKRAARYIRKMRKIRLWKGPKIKRRWRKVSFIYKKFPPRGYAGRAYIYLLGRRSRLYTYDIDRVVKMKWRPRLFYRGRRSVYRNFFASYKLRHYFSVKLTYVLF